MTNERNKVKLLQMPRKVLLLVAVLSTGGGILFGYDIGVVSGALLQLKKEFNFSCQQQEMIVSTMLLGALFGSVIGGYFIDKCGRKLSIILSSLLYFLGAVVLAVSSSYNVLIYGRVLLGLAMALAAAAECVYVSELAPQNIRGSLVSLNEVGITLGILLSYLVNYAFASHTSNGWRYMFGLSSVGAFITLGTVIFLPQSPRYLLLKKKRRKAEMALFDVRVRLSEENIISVADEFETMEKSITVNNNMKCLWFKDKSIVFPLIIAIGLVILQQSSGEPNVLLYANTILLGMGFQNGASASIGSVGLGFAKVIATGICLGLVDKIGRKVFLLIGCILMTLSILGLSIVAFQYELKGITICMDMNNSSNYTNYNLVNETTHLNETVEISKWVTFFSLMIFICAYSISFGPVSWIVLSEIFPVQFRGRMFSLATALNWAVNLLISSTFLDFVAASGGLGWPFAVSGVFGIISVVFVWFIVPETKGRSLEEITADLSNGVKFSFKPESCCGHKSDYEPYSIPLITDTTSISS